MSALVDVVPASVAGVVPAAVLARPIRLGHYQIAVLCGERAWSGADLAGRAKSYGRRYRAARYAALDRVNDALAGHGVECVVETRRHGRLVLAWRIAGIPARAWVAAAARPGLAGLVSQD